MKNIRTLTFSAMMAALTLLFLFLGAMLPSGQLGLCALAGLPAAAAVIRHGRMAGLLTWAASGALALFVLPSKGLALLYILVFGLYASLKSRIERLRRLPLEWLCKLLYANAVTALFFFVLPGLLAERVALPDWGVPVLFLAANGVFAVYDLALSRLLTGLSGFLRR